MCVDQIVGSKYSQKDLYCADHPIENSLLDIQNNVLTRLPVKTVIYTYQKTVKAATQ